MAQPAYPEASLLGIPLEVRHIIFEHASARSSKPKKLFRRWFEKKEVNEIIAKRAADNPAGPTPRAVYNDRYDEESEPEVDPDHQDEAEEDDEDEDEDDEDEDEDDEDEDEDNEEDEQDQDGDEDEAEGDEEDDEEAEAAETAGENDESDADMVAGVGGDTTETSAEDNSEDTGAGQAGVDHEMPDSPGTGAQADPTPDETAGNEEQGEADEQMHDGENEYAQGDQDAEGEDDDEMADQDDVAVPAAAAHTAPPPPPPPAPVIRPHSKWRHIPKFVRITQCPPPVELFLVCKQLNAEASHWFYDVAVLKIDATASFSHMSFFELALGQIAEAAFSPMKKIRKAEVTFVWDTTWIRAETTGYAANVFGFFLENRADYVLKILQQAPDLEQLVIHWHDSANDVEALALRQEMLEKFMCNLQATIDVKAHIIASDAKPHPKSIAGKRRLEFQGIVDNPPEAF